MSFKVIETGKCKYLHLCKYSCYMLPTIFMVNKDYQKAHDPAVISFETILACDGQTDAHS